MTIIQVIIIVLVIGIVVGLINRFGKQWIAAPFLTIINAIAIIGVVLWLLVMLLRWGGVATGTPLG